MSELIKRILWQIGAIAITMIIAVTWRIMTFEANHVALNLNVILYGTLFYFNLALLAVVINTIITINRHYYNKDEVSHSMLVFDLTVLGIIGVAVILAQFFVSMVLIPYIVRHDIINADTVFLTIRTNHLMDSLWIVWVGFFTSKLADEIFKSKRRT